MANIINVPQGKKAKSVSRKQLFKVVGIVLLIIALGAGGYYAWLQSQGGDGDKSAEVKAREKITGSFLDTGSDQENKVAYVMHLDKGREGDAARVYEDAVAKASTKEDKFALYNEYYQIAAFMKQYDHSVDAALGMVDLRPDLASLDSAAIAYERTGNKEKQAEYLRKIYESVGSAPEQEPIRIDIRERLKAIGEGI